jgi:transcription antitermination factor NusG
MQSVRILAMEWNDEFELRSNNLAEFFHEGDNVRIISGPLKGVVGVIQKRTNYPRVMVYIEAIGQGIVFDVDMNNLEKEEKEE